MKAKMNPGETEEGPEETEEGPEEAKAKKINPNKIPFHPSVGKRLCVGE